VGTIELSLPEPKSIVVVDNTGGASSTRMMSTRLAAPDFRDPLSCATTSSSDSLETRSGPRVGIQSRSSFGVMGIPTTGRVRR
jgi:hypothetical protein